jgi:hypothetical protein
MGQEFNVLEAWGFMIPYKVLNKLVDAWIDTNFGTVVRSMEKQQACMQTFLKVKHFPAMAEMSCSPTSDTEQSNSSDDDGDDEMSDGSSSSGSDSDDELEFHNQRWAKMHPVYYKQWLGDVMNAISDDWCSDVGEFKIQSHDSFYNHDKHDCVFFYLTRGDGAEHTVGYKVGGSTMGMVDAEYWPHNSCIGGACQAFAFAHGHTKELTPPSECKFPMEDNEKYAYYAYIALIEQMSLYKHPVIQMLVEVFKTDRKMKDQFNYWTMGYLT